MSHVLLLEPFGGLAGDMLLAALLDLGDPRFTLEELSSLAEELVPGEARLDALGVRRRGLAATSLEVRTPESERAPHRHLADLQELLGRARMSDEARARARAVLARLAEAEARVHGISPAEVHFHEVGAVDTLVDVAGAVLALERLGVRRVLVTPPYLGGGTVEVAHGTLPVPAPATAELLRGWRTRRGPGGERVTPTAAALLATLCEEEHTAEARPGLAVQAIGYGAGARDPEDGPPNLCRAQLALVAEPGSPGEVCAEIVELALNLDDATGEEVAHLAGRLRSSGALDVWTTPVHMKKGRPGVVVSVLCRPAARAALVELALRESPTLGVRWSLRERVELEREELVCVLEGERVRVKRRRLPGGGEDPFELSPEHEDLARLAARTGRPLRALEAEAVAAARRAADPGGPAGE